MAQPTYYYSGSDKERTIDILLSHVNILHSGAGGPQRSESEQCCYADFRRYDTKLVTADSHRLFTTFNNVAHRFGGVPRILQCDHSGTALVVDQDITTQWQFAKAESAAEVFHWERAFISSLVLETMYCAAEVFLETVAPNTCLRDLVGQFQQFMAEIGTRAVTVTQSSLVSDMMAQGLQMTSELPQLAWVVQDLKEVLAQFVMTRDCWHYVEGHAPAVVATFLVTPPADHRRNDRSPSTFDVQIHYRWNPPTISFADLKNVVDEDKELILNPSISAADLPVSSLSSTTVAYAIDAE